MNNKHVQINHICIGKKYARIHWRTSKVIIVSIYNLIHENKHIISFTNFVQFKKTFERFS